MESRLSVSEVWKLQGLIGVMCEKAMRVRDSRGGRGGSPAAPQAQPKGQCCLLPGKLAAAAAAAAPLQRLPPVLSARLHCPGVR